LDQACKIAGSITQQYLTKPESRAYTL